MVQQVQQSTFAADCLIEDTGQNGGGRDGLEYSLILRNSVFTLCPTGNSQETFRLYESFETGSIPIMREDKTAQKLNFLDLLIGANRTDEQWAPIVLIKSWTEIHQVVGDWRKDKAKWIAFQRRMIVWWEKFKKEKRKQIQALVDASFERKYGYAC